MQDQNMETIYYSGMPVNEDAYNGQHYLIVIDSNGNMRERELSALGKQRIYIGRDPAQNDIVLTAPFVSGLHGKIKLAGNRAYYADLGSTNGTRIEDSGMHKLLRRNKNYVLLKDGTILKIQYEEESLSLIHISEPTRRS